MRQNICKEGETVKRPGVRRKLSRAWKAFGMYASGIPRSRKARKKLLDIEERLREEGALLETKYTVGGARIIINCT
jgi:hypothetical protein